MLDRTFVGVVSAIGLVLFGTSASATTVFGSRLNHEPTPTEICNSAGPARLCSWVLTIGQQFVGHERAPKNGTIARVLLRSCSPGSFVLQLVVANPATHQARAIRSGPAINYQGNPSNCSGGLAIETFNVNIPVLAGQYLAVVATKVGFIYNASGDGTLVYDPLLPDGGGFRTTSGTGLGSGMLLLQAQYND